MTDERLLASFKYAIDNLKCTQFYCDNPLDYAGLCEAHHLLWRDSDWQRILTRWGLPIIRARQARMQTFFRVSTSLAPTLRFR